jgi:hypothetical protein
MKLPPKLITCRCHRMAFKFVPQLVRALLPRATTGTYILTDGPKPIYVGRSDRCLRTRLAGHPLQQSATHFIWEPCDTAAKAFLLECSWYHSLRLEVPLINQIHPATPAGNNFPCPFCGPNTERALQTALMEPTGV